MTKRVGSAMSQRSAFSSHSFAGSGPDMALVSKSPPPRLRLALLMRVELKRILHASVLECLRGINASFALRENEADR